MRRHGGVVLSRLPTKQFHYVSAGSNPAVVALKNSSEINKNCNNKYKLKVGIDNTNRPSLLQLKQDLKDLKYYVKVGEKYNVSDNCIRKWIRKYQTITHLE